MPIALHITNWYMFPLTPRDSKLMTALTDCIDCIDCWLPVTCDQ